MKNYRKSLDTTLTKKGEYFMKIKRISIILSILLLLNLLPYGVVSADSPQINYIFSGYEAELPGYAEGTVTITPNGKTGYCILYWADGENILGGYEKIASVKINANKPVEYKMVENMAIPDGAKKLAAVFSSSGTYKPENLSEAAIYDIPVEKQFNSGKLEMTFASVSDVHVNYNDSNSGSDNYCGAPYKWTQALNYFAELDLDMVNISGDCTSAGGTSEYEVYAKSIADSSYDPNKIYMARGNHDSQENANYIKYSARDDMVRPFENSPWFYVLKKGDEGEKDNLFIYLAQELSSISNTPSQDNFSAKQLDWLENLLKIYAGTNTNIFIVGHSLFHNWGPGDRYDGIYVQPLILKDSFTGNMRLQKLLIEYKEAVFMTGHTHLAFSEMVNYSDENNTACRMIHNSSTSQQRVYNSSGTSIIYRASGCDNKNGSEGYVVGVYENDIVYNGTNLTTKEKIPTACYIFRSYSEDRSQATGISVTKLPDKTSYNAGDFFDPNGIEVTATYADGTSKAVQGWGLKNNNSLPDGTKEVKIVYGNLEASVPVKMSKITDGFEGDGTKESPYLIQSPADFALFTKCFESKTGSSSNDDTTFGKGMYFLQTADIDMTGYSNYKGTNANGNAKYGFSGVYNGNGHTLKATLNSSASDVSIFPYVNGVVMNVDFRGSLSASTYAQPIRTVGSNGKIVNCSSVMTLSSSTANGLSLSNYGTAIRYFSNCTISGSTKNVYSNTNTGATYIDCMYDGALSDTTRGSKVTNYREKAEALNAHESNGISKAVEILKKYDSVYSAKDINLWLDDMTVATMIPSYDDALTITESKTLANYSSQDMEIYAYEAAYDTDRKLTNVKREVIIVPADSNKKISLDFGDTGVLYLWNENMKPYFSLTSY